MADAKRWNIDYYKGEALFQRALKTSHSHWTTFHALIVGSVSVNQANPNLAATAHLKRFMA